MKELEHNLFKKDSILKMDFYDQYLFAGSLYDYIVNYLSTEEIITGECDSSLIYEDSESYLFLHELYPSDDTVENLYLHMEEMYTSDFYNNAIGTVYDYIVKYLSTEEMITGEYDSSLVYQDSEEYLLLHELSSTEGKGITVY